MKEPLRRCFAALCLMSGLIGLVLTHNGHAQRDAAIGVESVFLDTDTGAAKKLGAARDLIAARQWGDGIDLVRQIAEQHGDRMVAIGPRRYVSVATYCDILLSSLPEEGLKLYRARADAQARRWYEAARAGHDETGLHKIVERAFLSSYGDEALLRLGQFAWDRGNLPQARSYWEKLLPPEQPAEPGELPPVLRYPGSGIDTAQIRARLVLCSLMQGQMQRGQRELAEFRRLYPQAEGHFAGRTGNLGELLARQTEALAGATFPRDNERIRTFGGNACRNQVQSAVVDVGSMQWSTPLSPVGFELPGRSDEPFERPERVPLAPAQDVLCYYPLVYDNLVLYCDETAIYARQLLSAEGGQPAWDMEAAAVYTLPAEMVSVGLAARRVGLPRFTMSIDGSRLYAHLGGSATRNRHRATAGAASLLVCLDLDRQGDLVWNVKPEELQDEAGGAPWTFDGAPLAVEGRVYIALRRREPQLQLNVACLDSRSAKVLWNRKICLGLEHFGPEVAEVHHQLLTVADERLYYCTNRGAIAALDVHDGAPQWVTTYPRADIESASAFNKRQQHGPNPCVCHDGLVFVAPTDSDHVLAYDAETGLVRWDHELKGNVHQLVGVDDGKLIAAGDLLWALDADDGRTAWIAGRNDPEAATCGRAAIAGGLVYWPRREELVLVDVATGNPRREIDLKEQHSLHGGGNVTLTDGFLVLGQSDRIAVFSEYGGLRKRRENQITQRPDDPRPHFEMALIAEAMNEPEAAREAYLRARDLARREDVHDGRPLRDAACGRLSAMLVRLGTTSLAAGDRTEAVARLAEAAEIATTPETRIEASGALARAYERLAEPGAAVAAWQQLLDASASGDRDDPRFESAARMARNEIDRLIVAHGRDVYAAVEARAADELAQVVRRHDAGEAAMFLCRYPNASAANSAALQLAAWQRAGGDSFAADQTYKLRLAESAGEDIRPAALAGLARNAEARQGWLSAERWWRQLYDHYAGATIAVDGLSRAVEELVPERLDQIRRLSKVPTGDEADATLVRRWERLRPSSNVVIVPEGTADSAGHRGVLIAGTTLRSLGVSDGNLRWETTLPGLPEWARYVADVLVVGTSAAAIGVAPANGRILWRRSFAPDGHSSGPMSFRAAGDRLCCLSTDSGVWCLFPETGEVVWRYRPRRGRLQARWSCSAERVVVQRLVPDRWDILDAREGTLLAEGPGPARSWHDDPAPVSSDRLLAFADELGIPQILEIGKRRFERFGDTPFTLASAGSDRARGDAALVVALDSERFARLDPASGVRLWTARAGVEPPHSPREAACEDGERAYFVAAGVLRCHSLVDGHLLWEQYVGPRGDWRVRRAGPWVVAHRLSTDDRTTILLCDPATGAFVQRLWVEGESRSVRFHAEADCALVVTDTRLIGFEAVAIHGE